MKKGAFYVIKIETDHGKQVVTVYAENADVAERLRIIYVNNILEFFLNPTIYSSSVEEISDIGVFNVLRHNEDVLEYSDHIVISSVMV